MEKEQDGKNWYFEGDELVIKKGKWIIDRYKKHLTPSSDKDRLREDFMDKFYTVEKEEGGKVHATTDGGITNIHRVKCAGDIWNWILSHAKELGELV